VPIVRSIRLLASNGNIGLLRLSPRVRDLFATAVRLAARARLSVILTELEGRELALFGNLETALKRLRERVSVTIAIPGVGLDRRARVRIAAYELTAEAAGGKPARSEIIQRIIKAEPKLATTIAADH
jgi:hypothetical protein